jgi:DNA polymerase III alpha subunit
MSEIVHLHAHGEGSILDGFGRVEHILKHSIETGFPGHTFTDHGTMSRLFAAWRAGAKLAAAFGQPFKVVGGCELYMVLDKNDPPPYRKESDDAENQRYHLTALIMDEKGYENAMRLAEIGAKHAMKGGYNRYYPLVDLPALATHQEGLVICSGCYGGVICKEIQRGNMNIARQWMRQFRSVFGDRFYAEIMPTEFIGQRVANEGVITLAQELGIPVVATNDVHYPREEDYETHEILCAIQSKSKLSDRPKDETGPDGKPGKRFRLSPNCYWMMPRARMEEAAVRYHPNVPLHVWREGLDRTLEVLERITYRHQDLPSDLPPFHFERLPQDMQGRFAAFQEAKGLEAIGGWNHEGIATAEAYYATYG